MKSIRNNIGELTDTVDELCVNTEDAISCLYDNEVLRKLFGHKKLKQLENLNSVYENLQRILTSIEYGDHINKSCRTQLKKLFFGLDPEVRSLIPNKIIKVTLMAMKDHSDINCGVDIRYE